MCFFLVLFARLPFFSTSSPLLNKQKTQINLLLLPFSLDLAGEGIDLPKADRDGEASRKDVKEGEAEAGAEAAAARRGEQGAAAALEVAVD